MAPSGLQSGGRRDGIVDLVTDEERGTSRTRGALLASVSVVGFCLSTWAIRESGPIYLDDSFLAARFEAFRDYDDQTDLLFIGNSRVNHHIDPALVDEEFAHANHPLRSFNFGVGAMNAIETSYVLEEIFEDATPRYVVLDPGDLRSHPRGNNAKSERFIKWHDFTRTRWVWEHYAANVQDRELRFQYFQPHLRAFLYRTFNTGRGAHLLGYAFRHWCTWHIDLSGCGPALRYRDHVELLRETRGFIGLHDEVGVKQFFEPGALEQVQKNREAFKAVPEVAMRRTRRMLRYRRRNSSQRLPVVGRKVLLRVHAQSDERGSLLTILLSPRPDIYADYVYQAQEEGLVPRLLDYGDPEQHPAFYDADNRFEASHMHARATPLFSKRLVADLLELWSVP